MDKEQVSVCGKGRRSNKHACMGTYVQLCLECEKAHNVGGSNKSQKELRELVTATAFA